MLKIKVENEKLGGEVKKKEFDEEEDMVKEFKLHEPPEEVEYGTYTDGYKLMS